MSAATTAWPAACRSMRRSPRRARRSRRRKSSAIARFGRELGAVGRRACAARSRPISARSKWPSASAAAVAGIGARAIVTLVAADDRIGRYRHPVPTVARWGRQVMVVVCAQRHGLVAVAVADRRRRAGAADSLEQRTAATAGVFEQPAGDHAAGATGAELFRAAAQAYADAGFPGEETAPSPGRRDRLPIARVDRASALARNRAGAAGVCVESEHHRHESRRNGRSSPSDGLEIVTSSPDWPAHPDPRERPHPLGARHPVGVAPSSTAFQTGTWFPLPVRRFRLTAPGAQA